VISLSLDTEFIFDLLNTSDWPGVSVLMFFKKCRLTNRIVNQFTADVKYVIS